MTQRSIDRLLLFSTLLIIVTFSVTALFMNDQLVLALHYEYMQEMLRRAAYSSSMLTWVGTADYIQRNINAGFSYLADSPFDLTITTSNDTFTLSAVGTYPYTAECYDRRLNGSVELQEQFHKAPQLGCTAQTLTGAASFLVIAVLLYWTLVKGANLFAQRFPQRTGVARLVLYTGFFMPTIVAVCMQFFVTSSQITCMQLTWLDDAKRTVDYLGAVFQMVTQGLGAEGTALYGPTMKLMNDNLITDGRYGLTSITNGAKEMVPDIPRTPSNVREVLYSHEGPIADYKHYFEKEHTFLTTYSISGLNMLVVLVHMVDNSMRKYSDAPVVAGLLMLLLPLLGVGLLNVFFFPYDSLGRVAPTGVQASKLENVGPHAWRASPHWVLWKVVHFTLIVALMVGGCFVYVERLSQYYSIAATYEGSFNEKIATADQLQQIGNLQLKNMVSLIANFVWWPQYVIILPVNELSLMDTALFYEKLSMSLSKTQDEGMTNTYTLSQEAEGQYPMLINSALGDVAVKALDDPNYAASSMTYYIYLLQWDLLYIRDLIANDVAKLSTGDFQILFYLIQNAANVGTTGAIVSSSVTSVLQAAAPYQAIAASYQAACAMTPYPVTEELNSEEGRAIVEMENKLVDNLDPQDMSAYSLSFAYIWDVYACTYMVVIALVMAGGTLIFDFFYTGAFFGLSDGTQSALRKTRYLPSNDYTAPTPYIEVNHHHLWSAARKAYLAIAFTTILAGVVVVMGDIEAKKATTDLLNVEYEDGIVTRGSATSLYKTSMVASTCGCWLRAMLSVNPADIVKAISYTMIWTSSELTQYEGGAPERDQTEDSALRHQLYYVSSLVQVKIQEGTMQKNQYVDFAAFLNMLETYYPFAQLEACLAAQSMLSIVLGVSQVMRAIVKQNEEEAEGGTMLIFMETINPTAAACGLTDGLVTYLQRAYALSTRAYWYQMRDLIAENMYAAAMSSTANVDNSMRAVHNTFKEAQKTPEDFAVPWMVLIAAWLVSPLILFLYSQAAVVFESLYSG